MDMLYRAYSCPMDLMNQYINRGRFGKFVSEFLTLENERRKAEAEKERNRRLWAMYIHSYTDETFEEFRDRVCKPESTTQGSTTRAASRDAELTEKDARAIVDSLFT